MRCADCGKFVSYGEPEIEIDDENVSEGRYSVVATMYLTCAECGTQLKSFTFDAEFDLGHECSDSQAYEHDNYECSVDTEATEKRETERNGKPIRTRYQRTFYGIEFSVRATCGVCQKVLDTEESLSEQASSFEEL